MGRAQIDRRPSSCTASAYNDRKSSLTSKTSPGRYGNSLWHYPLVYKLHLERFPGFEHDLNVALTLLFSCLTHTGLMKEQKKNPNWQKKVFFLINFRLQPSDLWIGKHLTDLLRRSGILFSKLSSAFFVYFCSNLNRRHSKSNVPPSDPEN